MRDDEPTGAGDRGGSVAGPGEPAKVRREKADKGAKALQALPSFLAALPFLVLASRVLWHRRSPVYSGDGALLELAVRSAAHGDRTLGPYSRFGFFHPGPAMFYALAPFEWITGGATWAMPLGVALVNALVVAVFVILVQRSSRRFFGGRTTSGAGCETTDRRDSFVAGSAAASAVLAYALAVDVGLLQILWNPLLIVLPVALVLVAAALVDGWGTPAALTVGAGTVALQAEVSTAPLVFAASACAVAWLVRDEIVRRRAGTAQGSPTKARPAADRPRRLAVRGVAVCITALAVVAWVPPLIQQLRGSVGNFGSLWHFFRSSSEPQPGWRTAASFAGRELAVFPSRIIWRGSLTTATVNRRWDVIALVVFIVVAAILVMAGARRRSRPLTRLGVIALASAVVAVYSMASVRGPVYWYLGAYMSAIAVPLLLGWLLLIVDALHVWGPRLVVGALGVLTVIAVASAATTPIDDNRAFPNEPIYRANTEAAWSVVHPLVSDKHVKELVLAGDPALLPTIAGVALKIEQSGVSVRVTPPLVPWFGPERLAPSDATPIISITTAPTPNGEHLIGYAPSRLLGPSRITISTSIG